MPGRRIHAEATICGYKMLVITGGVALLLMFSTIFTFIALNILTNSPLNVAAIILGMFCVATRSLDTDYDVVTFLTSALVLTIIIAIQSFNNLFHYQDLAKLPNCKDQATSNLFFSMPSDDPKCSDFEWNGGMVFFFVVVFIGNTIVVLLFPVFAFLVIKISLEKRAQQVHKPKKVATTTVSPRFFENLPALIV